MTVTALIVSHDGARWLPQVLDALAGQTRAPDTVVAVDTGSRDGSVALLREALGAEQVHELPADTPYAEAVRAGLEAVGATAATEHVWLLHDDSAPAPTALEELLAVAAARPEAALLGPKLREWPSLRRLLEVGVSVTGTARRETGLERGEYDQGQHDRVRHVLAVNTAGLLVRRDVLERIPLAADLPFLATDLDLGWRAARAGLVTLVVPAAVVFHAEAAHRGRRPHGPPHPRREERAALLRTVLANCAPAAVPLLLVRLLLGSLLRVVGLLLVRAPGEAWDEAVAAAGTFGRPWALARARRSRRLPRSERAPHREVRALLSPAWLPYRHGVDAITDTLGYLADAGRDALARRAGDRSRTWSVLAVLALLVLALVAARPVLERGALVGEGLLPAPEAVATWWSLLVHEPVGAWVLPAAVVATLLGGSTALLVSAVVVLAVPAATLAALRFLRRLVDRAPAWWGALSYGLLAVVTGVSGSGMLGPLVGLVLLPLLARSALDLLPGAAPERRRRARWRVTGWLALLAAFVPSGWMLAVAVGVLVLVVAARMGGVRAALPALVPLAVSPLLLLPWWVPRLDAPGLLLLDAGLPVAVPALDAWQVLGARVGGGAPGWWALGALVAATAALVRRETRTLVLGAWGLVVAALALAAVLQRATVSVPGTGADVTASFVFPLLVAQAAALVAAALAGDGLLHRYAGASFGWRQPVLAVVVLAALTTPVLGLAWWATGAGTDDLDRVTERGVPTYMAQLSADEVGFDVLVLTAEEAGRTTWSVRSGEGAVLGEEGARMVTPYDVATDEAVRALARDGDPTAVGRLVERGIGYVYATPPADRGLVTVLDGVSGLAPASTDARRSGAWQLDGSGRQPRPSSDDSVQPWLFAGQVVAVVAVGVLAAPGRRREEP
ncbi:MAG: glycosyltransferase family 2 protein [Nocardioides sp.]|nr:glycosyltransferase family 2 protein [Nocardioides sp.]